MHRCLAGRCDTTERPWGTAVDRAATQEVQLGVAAKPAETEDGSWRAVLGYHPPGGDNANDPLGHGSTAWMQELDEAKPLRDATHIDVSVAGAGADR